MIGYVIASIAASVATYNIGWFFGRLQDPCFVPLTIVKWIDPRKQSKLRATIFADKLFKEMEPQINELRTKINTMSEEELMKIADTSSKDSDQLCKDVMAVLPHAAINP